VEEITEALALKMGALHDRGVLPDVIDVHGASKLFSEANLVAMARAVLWSARLSMEIAEAELESDW
jgi:hypothetical protein